MSAWRRFWRRLAVLFRDEHAENELAREVRAHLTLLEDDFQRLGLSAADARLAARRAFGGVEQAKERQRDARSFVWLADAQRDMRRGCSVGIRCSPRPRCCRWRLASAPTRRS